jgi:hypothetical protein
MYKPAGEHSPGLKSRKQRGKEELIGEDVAKR